jgi:hypothetical protein
MTIRAGGAALPVQAVSDIPQSVTGGMPAGVMSMAKGHLVRPGAVPFGMPGLSPLQS